MKTHGAINLSTQDQDSQVDKTLWLTKPKSDRRTAAGRVWSVTGPCSNAQTILLRFDAVTNIPVGHCPFPSKGAAFRCERSDSRVLWTIERFSHERFMALMDVIGECSSLETTASTILDELHQISRANHAFKGALKRKTLAMLYRLVRLRCAMKFVDKHCQRLWSDSGAIYTYRRRESRWILPLVVTSGWICMVIVLSAIRYIDIFLYSSKARRDFENMDYCSL